MYVCFVCDVLAFVVCLPEGAIVIVALNNDVCMLCLWYVCMKV